MSSPSSPFLTLILLLLLANGGPVLMALFFGRDRANTIDGGRLLRDGYPILGPSKTWRGLTSALVVTPMASWGLGWGWALGLTVALAAMAGDLLVSFTKRRLGLPSGASVPLLDQLPEALIPTLLARQVLGLDWLDLGLAVGAFVVLDLVLTPMIARLPGVVRDRSGRGT